MRLTDFILTEDKSRFIKKNPYLSGAEKSTIMDFFKKNRQAEKEIDWNKSDKLKYPDFEKVILKYQSGRKEIVKHKSISGVKEGEDYFRVPLGRKDFLAYAIATYEGSKAIASASIGPCRGKWCTAHTETSEAWQEYTHGDDDVFVYVMNAESKWAVQINKDNKRFTVWNAHDKSGLPIPDFNVPVELFRNGKGFIATYNKIREMYDKEDLGDPQYMRDATTSFNHLVSDVQRMAQSFIDAQQYFWDENQRIINATQDMYGKRIKWLEEEIAQIKKEKAKLEKTAEFSGRTSFDDEIEKREKMIDKLQEVEIEIAENVEVMELSSWDDIDWIDDPLEMGNILDRVLYVYQNSDHYSDYFDFAHEHFGWSDSKKDLLEQSLHDFMFEEDGTYGAAQMMLADIDLHHPSIAEDTM